MVRSLIQACFFAVLLLSVRHAAAQEKSAYDLLPGETQAVMWIPNGPALREQWERTELAKLAKDDKIAPFFEARRQEIEKQFMDAGWRLSIQPEDLDGYVRGQMAVAWTSKADTPVKPYALALIVDVVADADRRAELLQRLEEQLGDKEVTKATLSHAGVKITKYTMPPRAGEFIKQISFVALVGDRLLSTDDDQLMKDMIDRTLGKSPSGTLRQDPIFQRGMQQAELSGKGHIEFFVRPLGFAKVIRSIAGSRSKSNTDMLAALEKQGFLAIECLAGEMIIGGPELDVRYNAYVSARKPLEASAKVLDFPNRASAEIPPFVSDRINSMLVLNWNANEAFWASEGLVDELAGTKGVFEEVIEGIKSDPNGPSIDIRSVLPNLTNDIYSISDNKEGEAAADSRRNLLAFKVHDAGAMKEVVDRAMKVEPDAEPVDFAGHTIWQVVRSSDLDTPEFDDFGDFGDAAPQVEEEEHWLNNWAITVHGKPGETGYLMFASGIEVIQDAIQLAKQVEVSPLVQTSDFQRVATAVRQHFGDSAAAAWRILRPKNAYRVNYELFRRGELKNSKSMLATILDRLLQKNEDIDSKVQQISGDGLPNFDEISGYLQPGGFSVTSTDTGWKFGGFLLGPEHGGASEPTLSGSSTYGTARLSKSDATSNR